MFPNKMVHFCLFQMDKNHSSHFYLCIFKNRTHFEIPLILKIKGMYNNAQQLEENVPLEGKKATKWCTNCFFNSRSDSRGLVCGLTQFSRREHICRAVLEAICFQTRDILEAMQADSKVEVSSLLVDGG